jgi:hypothetical protein
MKINSSQLIGIEAGTDKLHGAENAALQHAKHAEKKTDTVADAVVVEFSRSHARAEAYAPHALRAESARAEASPAPAAATEVPQGTRVDINMHVKELIADETADKAGTLVMGENSSLKMNAHVDTLAGGSGGTIRMEDGASLKLNLHADRIEGNSGTMVVGEDASVQMNLHEGTAVSGGALEVAGGSTMKATVRVDILAAAAPQPPAGQVPAAPVVPKEGNTTSLDAFTAVQTLQPQAVKQAEGRDEKEQVKEEGEDKNEDPRWRLYREVLDSMHDKPGWRQGLGRGGDQAGDTQTAHVKVHVRS